KDNQILSNNLKQCQVDYNNSLRQLQEKYVLFLENQCTNKNYQSTCDIEVNDEDSSIPIEQSAIAKDVECLDGQKVPFIKKEKNVETDFKKTCLVCNRDNK